jgi:hypothetical protein
MSTVFDNPHLSSATTRGGRQGGGANRTSQMTYMSSPLRPQQGEHQRNEVGDLNDQEGDVALVLSPDLSLAHGKGGYRGSAEEDYSITSFFDTEMFSQQKFQESSGVIFKAQEEYTL